MNILSSNNNAQDSRSSCSMFNKLVSMLAAVAVFRNYVLGNIATRTCRSAPNRRMPNMPF